MDRPRTATYTHVLPLMEGGRRLAVLTRDALARQLAVHAEISLVAAREEVRWFFDTIAGSLANGDEVRIHGFGRFVQSQRAARLARNPRTGQAVHVPSHVVVRFAPNDLLTQRVRIKHRPTDAGRRPLSQPGPGNAAPAPAPGPGEVPKRFPPGRL